MYRQLGNDTAARQNSVLALRSVGTVRQMIQQLSGVIRSRPAAPGYLRLGLPLEDARHPRMQGQPSGSALQLDASFAPARQALQNLLAQ